MCFKPALLSRKRRLQRGSSPPALCLKDGDSPFFCNNNLSIPKKMARVSQQQIAASRRNTNQISSLFESCDTDARPSADQPSPVLPGPLAAQTAAPWKRALRLPRESGRSCQRRAMHTDNLPGGMALISFKTAGSSYLACFLFHASEFGKNSGAPYLSTPKSRIRIWAFSETTQSANFLASSL